MSFFRLLAVSVLIIISTAFPGQTGFEHSSQAPVCKMNLETAAPEELKMDALLRCVINSQYDDGKGGLVIPENYYSSGSPVAVRKAGSAQMMAEVFIQSGNAALTRKAVESVGGTVFTEAGGILNCEVPLSSVKAIAAAKEVVSMAASAMNRMNLDSSRVFAKINEAHSGSGLPMAYKGKNVVVGLIDSGIDWKHLDFKSGGTSRIKYLWDMSGLINPPSGYSYGREYTKAMIDAGQCLETDGNDGGGHGTHVAGIAAGNGSTSSAFCGAAPEADIIFVKGFRSSASFSSSDVINGCNYIFTKAQELGEPAVINLSLGGHVGAHDGTSLYERQLSALTGQGKIIVASAGNEGEDYIHLSYNASGSSTSDASRTIWQINSGESQSIIDMWYPTGSISVAVAVYSSSGSLIGYSTPVAPGNRISNALLTINGTTYGRITIDATNTSDANNGAKEVYVSVDNVNGAYNISNVFWGLCTFGSGTFDAWVGLGGNFITTASSGLFKAADNEKSIGMPSTALKLICVGAFSSKRQWTANNGNSYYVSTSIPGRYSTFSSHGPSRDGRLKPDLVAPGQLIGSALSSFVTVGTGVQAELVMQGGKHQMMQGTSQASPHVAGVVALMLQRNKLLDYTTAFQILTTSASKDAYTGASAGNIYGNGKLNAVAALQSTQVGVEFENSMPIGFNLVQNFPNPFNPETNIRFTIGSGTLSAQQNGSPQRVSLKIYDILGNEVATLINELKPAGSYSITWNAGKYPSGVYFCELLQGNNRCCTKMIYLK